MMDIQNFPWILLPSLVLVAAILLLSNRPVVEATLDMLYLHDDWLSQHLKQVDLPTWKALQQTTGLSEQTVQRIRRGELERVTLGQLQQLARTLNLTLSSLLIGLQVVVAASAEEPSAAVSRSVEGEAEDREREALRQECMALQQALQRQTSDIQRALQQETFEELRTLLTSFPTLPRMVKAQPQLPAQNLLALFSGLENLLERWEIRALGEPWQSVRYDPQIHQGDSPDLQAGETVYVRFVGYRQGETILAPAKVSRTLPAAATPPAA